MAEKLNPKTPFVTCGKEAETETGATTEIFTTADVAETPEAVAIAVSAYDPADKFDATTLNGDALTLAKITPLVRKATFVIVPLETVAAAEILTLAGAEKTVLVGGFVIVIEGPGATAAGVERV